MEKITNPQLADLDKRTAEFYKLSHRYFNNLHNLHGRNVYKKELLAILDKAECTKPESKFEGLVLKNIKSNLSLNDVVIDYFSDPNFPLSVKEFFERIGGQGSWGHIEKTFKSPPYEDMWKHQEMTQEKYGRLVSPFSAESQNSAAECLPRIKDEVLKHGIREGLLPKDFDFRLLLLPPREGRDESSWNSSTGVFSLGSYGFEFYPKEGKIMAVPTKAYMVAFHEILGHGAHQIHSNEMPCSTRFTEEIGGITPTKSVTEGVAIISEERGLDFLSERTEELGLTKEDLEILRLEKKLNNCALHESMYWSLLKDMESREKVDMYDHFLKLTGNPIVARSAKEYSKDRFGDVWRSIGHTLGKRHYALMEDRVGQEFGEEYLIREKDRIRRASLKGVWSWEVYPEAVCYFLRGDR